MVSISGPIVNVLGAAFTGLVQVALVGSAEQGIGTLVTKQVVSNGTLTLELEPNTGVSYYSVLFTADSGPAWVEKWIVPDTESTVTPASLVIGSTRTRPSVLAGDINLASDSKILFGADGVTGSWRVTRSGDDLVFQRYESDVWVTKTTMTALGS